MPFRSRGPFPPAARGVLYFWGEEEPAMKVTVDHDLCEANGVCASITPEVFDLDDEDHLRILLPQVPARLADLVERAVGSCPKMALRLAGEPAPADRAD
jgi:ferredoxin